MSVSHQEVRAFCWLLQDLDHNYAADICLSSHTYPKLTLTKFQMVNITRRDEKSSSIVALTELRRIKNYRLRGNENTKGHKTPMLGVLIKSSIGKEYVRKTLQV